MQPYEPNPGPLAVDVTDISVLVAMSQLCGEAWKRLMGSRVQTIRCWRHSAFDVMSGHTCFIQGTCKTDCLIHGKSMILWGDGEVAMLKKILSIIIRESNQNPGSWPRVLLIFPTDRQEIPLVARIAVSRPWLSTWLVARCILGVQWLLLRDGGWRCGPSWQVDCLQDIGYLVWGAGRPPMK